MKILLAVHCFFPEHFYGTETYTFELARGLRARGHDVVVLSAVFPGEPARADEVTRYEYEGIPVVCVDKNRNPHTRIKETYYQPSQRALLERLLAEERPDLVHVTHLINHTGALLEATQAHGVTAVATFTDFFGFCFTNKLESASGRPCAGPSRRRTNCLACYRRAEAEPAAGLRRTLGRWPLSRMRAEAEWLLTRMPRWRTGALAGTVSDLACRPDVLRTLYRGYARAIAPTAFLRDAYARNGCPVQLRDVRFGVDIARSPKPAVPPAAPLRIGFIGQISAHKGPDLLVDAIRGIPAGRVEVQIHGPHDQDPGYMGRLREAARGLPIVFPGTFKKERMAEVLAGMDVLAIPSRWYENGPLVLLNALATHTPVVVSDVPGLTEFIAEGRDGFAFPMGDGRALARLLGRLAADPAAVRRMSADTAYPRTTDTMVDETMAVYREALAG